MSFSLPTEKSDRVKLFIAAGVLGVCAIWLVIYLGSQMSFKGKDRTLETPGWKIANELFAKISKDPNYMDIAFKVESEKPLKITVLGEVYNKDAFERLPTALKEINPQAEYEIQAEYKKK